MPTVARRAIIVGHGRVEVVFDAVVVGVFGGLAIGAPRVGVRVVGVGEGTAEFDLVGFELCHDVGDVTADVSALLSCILIVGTHLVENLDKRLLPHVNLLLFKPGPCPNQSDFINVRHSLIIILKIIDATGDIYPIEAVGRLEGFPFF